MSLSFTHSWSMSMVTGLGRIENYKSVWWEKLSLGSEKKERRVENSEQNETLSWISFHSTEMLLRVEEKEQKDQMSWTFEFFFLSFFARSQAHEKRILLCFIHSKTAHCLTIQKEMDSNDKKLCKLCPSQMLARLLTAELSVAVNRLKVKFEDK